MEDKYNRHISYMRISVTDRCNLRCFYCMPPEGICTMKHRDLLTYEEIIKVVKEGVELGIINIRLTGGEPLTRPGIEHLIRGIKEIEGVKEVSLTTNGMLLGDMAITLKEAGLDRVNISLDSLSPDKYRAITGGGELSLVLKGINASVEAGFKPVKINTVLMRDINDDEVEDFIKITSVLPLNVRFIELMPIGYASEKFRDCYLPIDCAIKAVPGLLPMKGLQNNGPAVNFRLKGAMGTVGFIGALSHNFCHRCNRIRLTADGKIKPCLNSSSEIDLRPALREGKGVLRDLLMYAVAQKPKRHSMDSLGNVSGNRNMYQIGG